MSLPTENRRRYRILYIHSTQVPPTRDELQDRFHLLSEFLDAEVVQPIWFDSPAKVDDFFGPGSFPTFTRGVVRYHWILWSQNRILYPLRRLVSYISLGRKLHRQNPFDCIIAYSHMTTGVCAAILKVITGAKLIIEIVTAPEHAYLVERETPTFVERMMHVYSDICLKISLGMCDRVHLLAPTQINRYPEFSAVKNSVFADFVNESQLGGQRDESELYAVLVGAPWYLKGVDVAIQAFRRVEAEFPMAKLKILGHFPDWKPLQALMGDSKQIEILQARPFAEAASIIRNASIMLHPSRCEGLPRVITEAMFVGIPVIATKVGGIPHIVRDGENGFLVDVNDIDAVEKSLRTLFGDAQLRRDMGMRGQAIAEREFTEERYVENFLEMVESTVEGRP